MVAQKSPARHRGFSLWGFHKAMNLQEKRGFVMTSMKNSAMLWFGLLLLGCSERPIDEPTRAQDESHEGLHLSSLAELSVEALRKRSYHSALRIEQRLGSDSESVRPYIASYDSDGLRVYARIDVPTSPMPVAGYPIVVFLHGWAGIDAAPTFRFYYADDSNYGEMIDSYAELGFAVFTPGFRGHGTVQGIPADGIEYLAAWDNGSYISPVFYAIDALNLIEGLKTVESAGLHLKDPQLTIDTGRINVVGHSQGGDVALIVAAVSGEDSSIKNTIAAASIWSGTFPSRFTQLETYYPMQTTAEAFMSGDGTWNGTDAGKNDAVNPNFVFGYPPDWIVTIEPDRWTWQAETWSLPTVSAAMEIKLSQMYDAINTYIDDIDDASYQIANSPGEKTLIFHDPRVAEGIEQIGAFNAERFLTEPITLQHSDRDFYSFSEWNENLCNRISSAGGTCFDFEYIENTHSLRVSEHTWFSSSNARPGFDAAIRRDIALFEGLDPTVE